MTRKCSHCNLNGHNSRTCPNRGGGVVKLFGVNLNGGSIRKCVSMGNLAHYAAAAGGSSPAADSQIDAAPAADPDGYASEDLAQGSSSASRERKKGVPWTEDEHRMFLLGLQKLGKGDWRGIARNFVVSRTPTQVASHAQKYFIRQTNASRRKRRSSLFDIVPDESIEDLQPVPMFQESDACDTNPLPEAPTLDEECESMDSTNSNDVEAITPKPEISQCSYPMVYPSYFSTFVPFPVPIWSDYQVETHEEEKHEIIKPTAVHPKTTPLNIEELVGMSTLSLREPHGESMPSFTQLGGPDRQSAFRAQPTARSSNVT